VKEHTSQGIQNRCFERRETINQFGEIEFEHWNKEKWSYEQVGDSWDFHNGGYAISCETVNKLVVPTVSKFGGIEIKFLGKVALKLLFKGEKKSWSTSAVARWSFVISITGGGSGCGPKISKSSSFEISDGSGFMGDYDIVHPRIKDAAALLREKLTDILIIEDTTIEELRTTFCNVWPLFYSGSYGYTLCNPVFNRRGDLTFELESPLDCSGQITVSERSDICLPSKIPHHSRPSIATTGGHFREIEGSETREASFSTTTTRRDDSPLRTPSSLHSHPSKVVVRQDDESFSFDGEYPNGVEDTRRISREKTYRSTERSTNGRTVLVGR